MFVSARRSPHRVERRARRRERAMAAVALVLIGAGLDLALNAAWFTWRWHTEGAALVAREDAVIAAVRQDWTAHRTPPPAVCGPFNDASSGPAGLLSAPTIGLRAPVLAGDGGGQLDVAVGHVTGSAWPGSGGTVVLAAHDVSYFSQINHLADGAQVAFVTPCTTYLYRVTGHAVVARGAPVYSSGSQPLLVMETCYPLNALFLTPQRYLVTAEGVGQLRTGAPTPALTAVAAAPSVPAPAPLAAQGLTLATNDTPLGELTLAGSPAPSFAESPGPIADESSVLAAYFGAVRAAEQAQPAWWGALAPGVAPAAGAPLRGARVTGFGAPLDPTLTVAGSALTGGSVDVTLELSGGPAPGPWHVHATMAVTGSRLVVTAWAMTRA